MNFFLLLSICLALPAEEKPSFPSRIGHAVEISLAKSWNATKYIAGKISRGAKITTHKTLTALEHSADYLDQKVVKSIKPATVDANQVDASALPADVVVAAPTGDAPEVAPSPEVAA